MRTEYSRSPPSVIFFMNSTQAFNLTNFSNGKTIDSYKARKCIALMYMHIYLWSF